MLYYLLSFILASADLSVKTWIQKQPKDKLPMKLAKDTIEIRRETNAGFAGNCLEEEPEIVQKLSAMVLGAVAVLMLPFFLTKKLTAVEKLGMAFLLGGSISNVAERNLRGYVVDYVHVNVEKLYKADNKLPKEIDAIYRETIKRSPLARMTFNLADLFIVLGGIILGVGIAVRGESAKHKKAMKKAAKQN